MTALTEELQRKLRAVLSLRVQAPLPADIPIEIAPVGGGENPHGDYDVHGGLVPLELEIRTTAHPYAAWSYEEPGAWGKLLADLEAIPDGTVFIDQGRVKRAYLTEAGQDALSHANETERWYDPTAAVGIVAQGVAKGKAAAQPATPEIKAAAKPATPPLAFVSVGPVRISIRADEGATQWFAWDALGAKYYLRFRWGKGTVEAVYSTGSNYTVREFYHGASNTITLEEFAQLADIDVSQIPEEQRR